MDKAFVLSIAGFDPSAGAGVLADKAVFEHLGVYGLGVLTCSTVQNENEVKEIAWMSNTHITDQIEILKKYPVKVCKIGLTQNYEMLNAILLKVKAVFPDVKVIVDPILKTSSGAGMGHKVGGWFDLLDKIDVLTPNWEEMEELSGKEDSIGSTLEWSKHCSILLKGGHSSNPEKDYLFEKEQSVEIVGEKKRLPAKHGSGCVFSASLSSYLALGDDLKSAAEKSKKLTEQFLKSDKGLLGSFD